MQRSEGLNKTYNSIHARGDRAPSIELHILSWLAVNGTAAIVEYPGVLYRGGAEQKIRKYLVDNNYIDAVIQLPPASSC